METRKRSDAETRFLTRVNRYQKHRQGFFGHSMEVIAYEMDVALDLIQAEHSWLDRMGIVDSPRLADMVLLACYAMCQPSQSL